LPATSGGSGIGWKIVSLIWRYPVRALILALIPIVLIMVAWNSTVNSGFEKEQAEAIAKHEQPSRELLEATSQKQRKDAGLITAEQRQELAHQLSENFRKEDLEINVFTTDVNNDVLVLSSDLFKESGSRTTAMKELRAQWQDLLCREGFKTVSLTESGVFSSPHDFALQCPKTPQDRSNLAVGLESDFQNFGKGTTVFVTGANNEVLSAVMTSNDYKVAGNRAFLFEMMKKRGTVQLFCSAGFKEFRVYYLNKDSKPSRFPLNCGFSD
jgi:hypothetical protein